MQTYKSFAAADRAKKFYDDYSTVPEKYIKIRNIVKSKKKSGKLRMFANIEVEKRNGGHSLTETETEKAENSFFINSYSEDLNGLILSFADRYPFSEDLYYSMMNEWNVHKDGLKVTEKELAMI